MPCFLNVFIYEKMKGAVNCVIYLQIERNNPQCIIERMFTKACVMLRRIKKDGDEAVLVW